MHFPDGALYFPPTLFLVLSLSVNGSTIHSMLSPKPLRKHILFLSLSTSNSLASPADSTSKIHPESDHLTTSTATRWSQPLGGPPASPALHTAHCLHHASLHLSVNQLLTLSCSRCFLIFSIKPEHLPPPLRPRPPPRPYLPPIQPFRPPCCPLTCPCNKGLCSLFPLPRTLPLMNSCLAPSLPASAQMPPPQDISPSLIGPLKSSPSLSSF